MRTILIAVVLVFSTGFAGWEPCKSPPPYEVWTVAGNKGFDTRPVRYLKGGPRAGKEIMRAKVGRVCYEDTRPGKQKGKLQWRLWRLDAQPSGRAVGEVYCRKRTL